MGVMQNLENLQILFLFFPHQAWNSFIIMLAGNVLLVDRPQFLTLSALEVSLCYPHEEFKVP